MLSQRPESPRLPGRLGDEVLVLSVEDRGVVTAELAGGAVYVLIYATGETVACGPEGLAWPL